MAFEETSSRHISLFIRQQKNFVFVFVFPKIFISSTWNKWFSMKKKAMLRYVWFQPQPGDGCRTQPNECFAGSMQNMYEHEKLFEHVCAEKKIFSNASHCCSYCCCCCFHADNFLCKCSKSKLKFMVLFLFLYSFSHFW